MPVRKIPGELRVPKLMLQHFQLNARAILRDHPAGLWPIDPGLLRNADFMKRIATDKEIQQKFDVVLVPKM